MKNEIRVIAALFGALMLFNSAAAQQVISYVATTPAVSAPSGAYTDWTKTLQLPRFDTSLGTLTEVKFIYTGEVMQTAQGENMANGSTPFSYNISTSLTLARTVGSNLFAPAAMTLSGSGTSAAFDGVFDFSGASGFSFTQTLSTTASLVDSILSNYSGSGMIDFTATATATSSVSGSGEFLSQTISKASAMLSVEYTFTPIPEPSSYAVVIGLAGFGLVAFQRRRRSSI